MAEGIEIRGRLASKLRSSRTLLPHLQEWHDVLLDRLPFYNEWHLHPNAIVAHWLLGVVSLGVAGVALFHSISIAQAADACVSAATGVWSSPATWTSCGGSFPDATDTVTIATGHVVTVDVNSAAASMVIAANAAAGGNGVTLNPGITLAITGAITLTAPTAATSTLAVDGGSLSAASITIPGSATAGRFATVSVSTGTVTTTGNIAFTGTAAQARYISTGASTTNVGGDFGSGGTLTTSATGTIIFNGSASQAIGAYTTYNNVDVISTGGTVSFLGTTTIGGTLGITSGLLDMAAISPTVTGLTTVNGTLRVSSTTGTKTFGDLTIASGGTMSFTAAEAITVNGNVVVNGTGAVTGTTGIWTLQRVGGGTVSGTAASATITRVTATTGYAFSLPLNIPTLTATGAAITNNSTLTVATALGGTGSLVQGVGASLSLGGTSTVTTLTATAVPNTVNYTSTTGAQTVRGVPYHHLVISKSGQIGTLGAAATIAGDLSVSAGSLNDGGFQITGNATGILTVASGATLRLGTTTATTVFPTGFIAANIALPSGSTIVYNSNLAQTIDVPTSYANLSLVATAAVTKTIAGPLTVNGTLNVGTNNSLADAGNLITAKGDVVMTGSHTGTSRVLLAGGTAVHTLTGGGSYANLELDDVNGASQSAALTVTGDLDVTTGTWSSANTLTVSGFVDVAGILTIAATTGTKTFGGLVVMTGGIFRFAVGVAETVAVNGPLTIHTGGTMDYLAAGIVNLAGDLTINGTGTISGSTGLWTFSKVGGGTIGGTATSLTITGNTTFATDYVLSYPLTVNGMTVNAGVTEVNPSTITVNGTLGGAGTFTQGAGTQLFLRSGTITALNATAAGNTVTYIGGGNGTVKGTSYADLEINNTGSTASASGTVTVLDDLTVTAGTLNLAGSTFTVVDSADIFGTLTDTSGGGSGGLNTYQGLVTVHPGANWTGINGEAVDHHFQNGLVMNAATFVAGSGSYIFETNNQALTGTSIVDFRAIQVDGIELSASVSFDTRDALTLASGAIVAPDAAVVVNPTTVQGVLSGSGTLEVSRIASTADFSSQYRFATNTLTNLGVTYLGTDPQVVSAVLYSDLTISNSDGVSLPSTVTVADTLSLATGTVTTGAYKIVMTSTGSVVRTAGYVAGNFQKAVPVGTPTMTFELGDANTVRYTPVDITFAQVTVAGDLLASTTSGDHPNIAASGVTPSKSVNRYWTLDDIGTAFTTYNATFHFDAADLDPAGDTGSQVVAKYDGSWTLPVVGSRTSTSTQTTGNASFSDFQLGIKGPDAAPVASSVAILGTAAVGEPLAGRYTYTDAESDSEGVSTYQWYRNGVVIAGATGLSYLVVADDLGVNLRFEVTPVATAGTSPGASAQSGDFGPIAEGAVVSEDVSSPGVTSVPPVSLGGSSNPDVTGGAPTQPEGLSFLPSMTEVLASARALSEDMGALLLLLLALLFYLASRHWPWLLALVENRLFVSHLARSIDHQQLESIFARVGKVRAISIHERSSHVLRHGFVAMRTLHDADVAIKRLDESEVAGHVMRVERARTHVLRQFRRLVGLR